MSTERTLPETKTFAWNVVATALTGRNWCNFGDMQELAEWVMGHSIFTHEFARKKTWDDLKEAIFVQHETLRVTDWGAFNDREPILRDLHDIPKWTFTRGTGQRTQSPIETLREIAPDKPIIVVAPVPKGDA